MPNQQIHDVFDILRTTPSDRTYNEITAIRYNLGLSILHAIILDNDVELLDEALSLIPKANRIDAIECIDSNNRSAISYAAYNPILFKRILSEFNDTNKPVHVLCHINSTEDKRNLGIAIAMLENESKTSYISIGNFKFNAENGIEQVKNNLAQIPAEALSGYNEAKKSFNKKNMDISHTHTTRPSSELIEILYNVHTKKAKNKLAGQKESYKEMKRKLNERQDRQALNSILHRTPAHIMKNSSFPPSEV